ncbi:serine hydrolase [Streptomyces sp. NPDC003703]|uniref:serine hydrolase n=1 Tax=Streptomyces sp. NPDC003283 TaxID=3364681 RepID=UPI0036C05DD0
MAHTPDFPPGEGWEYSNTGYVLLSMIIQKATGQAVHQEIEDRILRPLGLHETRWMGTSRVPRTHSRGRRRPRPRATPGCVRTPRPGCPLRSHPGGQRPFRLREGERRLGGECVILGKPAVAIRVGSANPSARTYRSRSMRARPRTAHRETRDGKRSALGCGAGPERHVRGVVEASAADLVAGDQDIAHR